jgi:uncharacterized protein (TIGR00369 family)
MTSSDETPAAAAGRMPRVGGVVPLEILKSMSGLEFLSGLVDGRQPSAPIGITLDFWLTAVEAGRAVFEGRPAFAHYNPIGTVHGGYIATLLDSCMGCAVQTKLPQGQGYTTLEFKVNFVRAVTDTTGPVTATGVVITSGRRTATAEGRLTDATGRLLAHATTTCLILEL